MQPDVNIILSSPSDSNLKQSFRTTVVPQNIASFHLNLILAGKGVEEDKHTGQWSVKGTLLPGARSYTGCVRMGKSPDLSGLSFLIHKVKCAHSVSEICSNIKFWALP